MNDNMRDMVIDKLRDSKYKMVDFPSVHATNLPDIQIDFPEVRLPKKTFTEFRNAHLALITFVSAVLGRADFSMADLEQVMYGLATGKIEVIFRDKEADNGK